MASIVRKRDTGEKGNRGEFGTIRRSEAHIAVQADPGFTWPDGFDPNTAAPPQFDETLASEIEARWKVSSRMETRLAALHRAVGDRQIDPRSRRWGMSHEEAIEKARAIAATAGTPDQVFRVKSVSQDLAQYEESVEAYDRADARVLHLNAVYADRGSWNRAFLVAGANGHVHSSTNCSTCRPTTRFSWMTAYAGAEEDEIVQDAGYRACTVCYPSAPVGDARTLPTKMFSAEEIEAQQERERRAEQAKLTPAQKRAKARAEKLAAAVSKNGKPLRFEGTLGGYARREVVATEKDAVHVWERAMANQANLHLAETGAADSSAASIAHLREHVEFRRSMRPAIAAALAEKHGTTALEQKRRLDAMAQESLSKYEHLTGHLAVDDEDDYPDT